MDIFTNNNLSIPELSSLSFDNDRWPLVRHKSSRQSAMTPCADYYLKGIRPRRCGGGGGVERLSFLRRSWSERFCGKSFDAGAFGPKNKSRLNSHSSNSSSHLPPPFLQTPLHAIPTARPPSRGGILKSPSWAFSQTSPMASAPAT